MTTFVVLSPHRTTAELVGTRRVAYRFMTNLCPDRCNHAFNAAEFKLLSYESFEKPGKEGDDKQTSIIARLDSNREVRTDYQDPTIVAKIKDLSPRQKVKLFYEHIDVTETETCSMCRIHGWLSVAQQVTVCPCDNSISRTDVARRVACRLSDSRFTQC
jgi:hypothetical protein